MGSVAKNSLSLFIIKLPNPFLSIKVHFITKSVKCIHTVSYTHLEMDYTNAIIVSHGPATASSITSTVNKVFERCV